MNYSQEKKSPLESNKFREYQGYRDLCRSNAFFIETKVNKQQGFGTNLLEWLQSHPSKKVSIMDGLNLIYQMLKVFEEIQKRKMVVEGKFFLNLGNWYLTGKTLRTDNFHPENIILKEKLSPLEKDKFQYGKNLKKDQELMILYDLATLLYRLLKGEFPRDQEQIVRAKFCPEKDSLSQELIGTLKKMTEGDSGTSEAADLILSIYQNNFFYFFLDLEDRRLYSRIKDYTQKIHAFLSNLSSSREQGQLSPLIFININIILGRLTMFLRNVISMPINYRNFTQEIFNFVEESDQESRKFEEFFKNYEDLVVCFIEDQKIKKPIVEVRKIEEVLNDFSHKKMLSLKNLETLATSQIFTSQANKDEKHFLEMYSRLWGPFKNYHESLNKFHDNLRNIIKKF